MAYPMILAALADPTRRRIFETLVERPCHVGELAEGLPVSRPAVSQHLRVLRDAGLVVEHREGTRRIHRADPAGLAELRAYVECMWAEALADFAAAAEEAPPTPRRSNRADP
jgi:DNA-binding transcriptional ArsR family regulator